VIVNFSTELQKNIFSGLVFQEVFPSNKAVCWIFFHCISTTLLQTNVCQPLSKHYLAAGWSLEKRGYVRRDPSKRPLFCVNVGLISDTKNSGKFWELVLKGAGAFVFGISQKPCKFYICHYAWSLV
jgi:hypothetical protein